MQVGVGEERGRAAGDRFARRLDDQAGQCPFPGRVCLERSSAGSGADLVEPSQSVTGQVDSRLCSHLFLVDPDFRGMEVADDRPEFEKPEAVGPAVEFLVRVVEERGLEVPRCPKFATQWARTVGGPSTTSASKGS